MTDLTTDALKRLAARLQIEAPHVEDWEDEDGDPVPFADDIRAAVSAIRELIERREADGWQPIETAPKGGEQIDLWNGHERAADAFWIHSRGWVIWGSTASGDPDWENVSPAPTHWRPLPKPPTTEGASHARE